MPLVWPSICTVSPALFVLQTRTVLVSMSNGGQWVRGLSACQLHAFLLDEQTTKARPRRRTTRQLAQIRLIEHLLFIRCLLRQHPQCAGMPCTTAAAENAAATVPPCCYALASPLPHKPGHAAIGTDCMHQTLSQYDISLKPENCEQWGLTTMLQRTIAECKALEAQAGQPCFEAYRQRCHLAQLGASIDQPEEAPRRWCDWEAHGVLGELLLSQLFSVHTTSD